MSQGRGGRESKFAISISNTIRTRLEKRNVYRVETSLIREELEERDSPTEWDEQEGVINRSRVVVNRRNIFRERREI